MAQDYALSIYVGTPLGGPVDGTGVDAAFGWKYWGGMCYDRNTGDLIVTSHPDQAKEGIRRISMDGKVTTVAQPIFLGSGVVTDSEGNIYFSEHTTLWKLNRSGGKTLMAGKMWEEGPVDGPALDARFSSLAGLVLDTHGNFFFAEVNSHTIRKLSADGVVSTIAGRAGQRGYADGLGVSARFSRPSGMAIDSDNNLYIADAENSVIRKISPEGLVSTVAGSAGVAGFLDGPASAAQFNYPTELSVDPFFNIYVCEASRKLRRIANGRVETVIDDAKTPQDLTPVSVTTDPDGNLYGMAGYSGLRTAAVSITPFGQCSMIAGGYASRDGIGKAALFYAPGGAGVDPQGNLLICDQNNHTIRKATPQAQVSVFAGLAGVSGTRDGSLTEARFNLPNRLAVYKDGTVYVSDSSGRRLRKISVDGMVTTLITGLSDSASIAVTSDGDVVLMERSNDRIVKISKDGVINVIASKIGTRGGVNGGYALAVDETDTVYYFARQQLWRVNTDGTTTALAGKEWVPGEADGVGTLAQFWNPSGLILQSPGKLVLYDAATKLRRYDVAANRVESLSLRLNSDVSMDFLNLVPLAAGSYGEIYLSDDTHNVVIRAAIPTSITAQPKSVTVGEGQPISLEVRAEGQGPLTYQWRRGAKDLIGANTSTLTMTSVSTNDAGLYSVVINGMGGTVQSGNAVVKVTPAPTPPSILTPPLSSTNVLGSRVTLSVATSGSPPFLYQWRRAGVDLAGATNATFVIAQISAEDAGLYAVSVSNSVGFVISQEARVSVGVPPTIALQPANSVVPVGKSVSFAVEAAGSEPLYFQWLKEGLKIVGESTSSLTIRSTTLNDAGSYSAWVTNAFGSTTSRIALLDVVVAPVITEQPTSVAVKPGASFSLSLQIAGKTSNTFQWIRNGTPIPGAIFQNYSVEVATPSDAGSYTVHVSNLAGSVVSATAVVQVFDVPVITAQPASQNVGAGAGVQLTVTASGVGPFRYQWLKDGIEIAGATEPSYSVPMLKLADQGSYSVTVSNAVGGVTSDRAIVRGAFAPVILAQPQGQTATLGSAVTLSVQAGGTEPFSYQWLKDGVAVTGAVASTLNIPSLTTGDLGAYTVFVRNAFGAVTSEAASVLSVKPGVKKWEFTASGAVNGTPAIGPDGTVYFGASGNPVGKVYAVNGATGQKIWDFATGAQTMTASPALGQDGTLYVGSWDFKVYALNSATGAKIWEYATSFWIDGSAVVDGNGRIYVGSVNSQLYALDAAKGTSIWQFSSSGGGLERGGPSMDNDGMLFTAAKNGAVYGVRSSNGSKVWTFNTGENVVCNPALTADGNVIFGTRDTKIYSLKRSTGVKNWEFKTGGLIETTQVLDLDGNILATSNDQNLYSLSPVDGSKRWSKPLGGSVGSPLVGRAGKVYVRGGNKVHAFNLSDGVKAWELDVASPGQNECPAIGLDGTLYVGANSGKLIAVSTESVGGLADSTWPKANADLRNTGRINTAGLDSTTKGPPVIAKQPASVAVSPGTPAVFTVVATGAAPLLYQWKKDGLAIAGASGSTYAVPSAAAADEGTYSVVVTNPAGEKASAAAFLTVAVPPFITSQPQGQTVVEGKPLSLSVMVTGTGPFTYVWKKDGVVVTNASAATYSVATATGSSAGVYNVTVSGPATNVVSDPATVVVLTVPTAVINPASKTVSLGDSVSFSVTATGALPRTYQWRKDGQDIPGATGATYQLSGIELADAGSYTVVVANIAGSITSSAALLNVNSAPVIVEQPAGGRINQGANLLLAVKVVGSQPLAYQWRKDGGVLVGAIGATYAITNAAAAQTGAYSVRISNALGEAVSDAALVTVVSPPRILRQPTSQSVNLGAPATFEVLVEGTEPLTFRWRRAGKDIAGANSSTLTLPVTTLVDAAAYTVIVINSAGSVASSPATLSFNTAPEITQQPAAQQTANLAASVSFCVTAVGTAPLSYQWKRNGTAIPGAVKDCLVLDSVAAADAGTYSVAVSNVAGQVASSDAVLTINLPPRVVEDPKSFGAELGASATFTVRAEGSGPIFYQWRRNGLAIPGATGAELNLPSVSAADLGSYTVRVSNAAGAVTSAPAVLSLNTAPVIVQQPAAVTANVETSARFAVVASGAQPMAYQWMRDGVTVSNGSGAELLLNNLTEAMAGVYSVSIRNSLGVVVSQGAVLTVIPLPKIVQPPQNLAVVVGKPARLAVTATGASPIRFQWFWEGSPIAGAVSQELLIPTTTLANAGSYAVQVTGPAGSVMSSPVVLTILPLSTQTIQFSLPAAVSLTNPPVVLGAAASSQLPVVYSLVSGPARLADGVLTLTGVGRVTLRALQPGDADFEPAPEVVRSLEVRAPADPQIPVAQGETTTVAPWLSGLPGVQFALVTPPDAGSVILRNGVFEFTAPASFTGVAQFTYSITDALNGAITPVRVFLVIQPNKPVFSMAQTSYSVSESAGFLLVSVRKNVSSPARVGLRLIDNTAKRFDGGEGDFSLPLTFIDFDGPETNRVVAVSIINDSLYEGDETFAIELVAESVGASVAPDRAKSVVTIVDDDSRFLMPFRKDSAATPARDAFLAPRILPAGSGGMWRFVGERHWRVAGTVSEPLPAGIFEVEFKPVQGFAQPLPATVELSAGGSKTLDVYYTPAGAARRGDLRVICDGTTLGGWKLEEEPDSAYRPSGSGLTNLVAGTYTLEFKPVDGFVPPGIMIVEVTQNNMPAVRAAYVPAPPAGTDRSKPAVVPFGTGNYPFIGQITRGDGEMGSGFVVKERVVLTAAHVVFDQRKLADAKRVRWFYQKHRGAYQPAPQIPRGWVMQEGYASRRAQEGAGSSATVFAQNLDAAAIFFSQSAGRGGSGGFLASTNARNEWLTGFSDAVLSGYPIDGIARADQEKIHETPPRPVVFNPVLGLPTPGLYRSTDLLSYPGNSGGPLCVRFADGRFYPAGIFVGVDADNIYVKGLDEKVVDLIDLAEKLSITSTNATGGGVILPGLALGAGDVDTGVLEVALAPDAANDGGAGWRLLGGDPNYTVGAKSAVALLDFDFTLEFKPVAGFVAPSNRVVSITLGSTNHVDAIYRRVQSLEFLTAGPLIVGQPVRLSAAASSGLPVSFEAVSGASTVIGDTVTASTVGRAVIRARQEGDSSYAPAFVEKTFEVVADASPGRPRLAFAAASGLQLTGQAGATYRIEQTDSLRTPVTWSLFKSVTLSRDTEVVPGAGGVAGTARFYRASIVR